TILLFSIQLAIGQADYSEHSVRFFKNNKEKKVKATDIWIVWNGTKFTAERVGEIFRLPIIDPNATVELGIKTNRMEFVSISCQPWMLNNGASITIGKLTRIDKLLSVAEYNGRRPSDDNWDIFSKRFFIAGRNYTIDIEGHEKVKRLDFVIINPRQEGDGGYVIIQKVVKLKR
ncbi:MAG: hypothetical protein AAFV25_27530, partial [Bacteroidota bacterium]